MKFSIQKKLIEDEKFPEGILYRLILVYVIFVMSIITLSAFHFGDTSNVSFYLIINILTVVLLTWGIRKSFQINSHTTSMALFRIGVFLQINSSIASTAGGLSLISHENSSLIAAVLYIPSLPLIMYSFKKFIRFFNKNYTSVVSMSLTDELTGLPNRRHLNIKLIEMESRACTVCIADIDNFKKINDTYGHDTGDWVLTKVGGSLKKIMSENIFISRSGGEEFVIIIDDLYSEELIENIKSAAADEIRDKLNATMSIGVALKRSKDNMSYVMTKADQALYRAKSMGRDRIIYSSTQSSIMNRRDFNG